MDLMTFFTEVYQHEKPLRASSRYQLELSIGVLNQWHGKPVQLEELNAPLINRWLMAAEGELAPKTLKNRRGNIIAVWRYAAEEHGLCQPPIDKRIRRVQIPKRIPKAWTLEELKRMIDSAHNLENYYNTGIRRADFWEGFIRVGYDTALRLSDMLALPVHIGGMFCVIQEKTQEAITCQLRKSTLEVLDRMRQPEREFLFQWGKHRSGLWRDWDEILTAAGLPTGRHHGPQMLRRTSATHLAAISEQAASQHLGHSTPDLARRHYIDPSIAYGPKPLPPEVA